MYSGVCQLASAAARSAGDVATTPGSPGYDHWFATALVADRAAHNAVRAKAGVASFQRVDWRFALDDIEAALTCLRFMVTSSYADVAARAAVDSVPLCKNVLKVGQSAH